MNEKLKKVYIYIYIYIYIANNGYNKYKEIKWDN